VWIYTALPCTTPRPAPKSSTDDLAWDLWARPPPKRRPYFGWVSRGGVSRSLTDHSSPTPRRPRLKNKQHRPGIRPTDERPEPSTARRTLFSNRDGSRYGHPDNKNRILNCFIFLGSFNFFSSLKSINSILSINLLVISAQIIK
jgi:hypothetical protein